jgi:deoxyribodipyrimidine photo-lyase
MQNSKQNISLVWLKRDLRLQDNEAIFNALQSGNKVLLMYAFEDMLLNDEHYSQRHWDFVKESLRDLNERLKVHNSKVLVMKSDIMAAINQLFQFYKIDAVYSHQETGIKVTYDRDKAFERFCKNSLITWHQNINNGVVRGLKNRVQWFESWDDYMSKPQLEFQPKAEQLLLFSEVKQLENFFEIPDLNTNSKSPFQKGGTTTGLKYTKSFFDERHKNYMFHISKPELARRSCSRLSPYLAWGNLSVRQVYQQAQVTKNQNNARHIAAFASRLRWQAHFIQKFEMECSMEFISINKAYQKLKKSISVQYQKAWREGQTGFPLVDASMRCLKETGYLNFRMRALVVSFFTHCLWQPWQDASKHLSRMFLDFEPGIHYPQLQMQAGETGINTLRIYNPIKNSQEHDAEAEFIKRWVPELRNLPIAFIHEPYLLTPLEEKLFNFTLGKDYPKPIVDLQITRKRASDVLWNMQKQNDVKSESLRILKKHTLKDRTKLLNNN